MRRYDDNDPEEPELERWLLPVLTGAAALWLAWVIMQGLISAAIGFAAIRGAL